MKKLVFAMGFAMATIVMTSCSADSIEEQTNQSNSINSENYSAKISDSISVSNTTAPPPPSPGTDDKDRPKS